MTRPWSRAGRVVLIRDITASDRERLPDWSPPDEGMGAACWIVLIWLAIAAGLAAWAFA